MNNIDSNLVGGYVSSQVYSPLKIMLNSIMVPKLEALQKEKHSLRKYNPGFVG
jgi:hypothetical protein